jgi:hypothetical protein
MALGLLSTNTLDWCVDRQKHFPTFMGATDCLVACTSPSIAGCDPDPGLAVEEDA